MQEFNLNTKICFGNGALEKLRGLINRRVLIVCDNFGQNSGMVERVAGLLSGCEVTVFSEVVPDPTIEVVVAGVKRLQASGADVIIAVGGGSVIDAAKAIRLLAAQKEIGASEVSEFVAIPTTSGTGSEVTKYSVILDAEKKIKYPLIDNSLSPDIAILDPALTATAPPNVTADSGMDVLVHAVEAYVSKGANDFSDALAEKAARLVIEYLPRAFKDGGDAVAREKMHNASCMAGIAFSGAGLGLCHGMAHSIGAKLRISHGRANAMLLPSIVNFNAKACAEKYARLAKLLELPSSSAMVGVNQLVRTLNNLNKTLEIPASLKAANIDLTLVKAAEDEIINASLADMCTASNPVEPIAADVKAILEYITIG